MKKYIINPNKIPFITALILAFLAFMYPIYELYTSDGVSSTESLIIQASPLFGIAALPIGYFLGLIITRIFFKEVINLTKQLQKTKPVKTLIWSIRVLAVLLFYSLLYKEGIFIIVEITSWLKVAAYISIFISTLWIENPYKNKKGANTLLFTGLGLVLIAPMGIFWDYAMDIFLFGFNITLGVSSVILGVIERKK
tara:strand:- start:64 stop:651 length:588 start_codon:yes stop_codon:yes gene_type:complete